MSKKKPIFYQNKWFKAIVVIAVILIVGLLIKNGFSPDKKENGVVYISVGKPKISDITQTVDVRGKVESSNTRSIFSNSEVRVIKVIAKEGYAIDKGAALLEGKGVENGMNVTFQAPIEGVVTSIAKVDQTVDKTTPLAEISSDNELLVTANVPQRDSYNIKPGQNAEIKVDSGKIVADGKIVAVASNAKEISGDRGKVNAVEVCISFKNKDKKFKIGYDVDTTIKVNETKDALSIPKTALLTENGKQYVFTLDNNNVAHKTFVETGIDNGSNIQIKSGLKKSSRVIFLVSNDVKDGKKVDPQTIKTV